MTADKRRLTIKWFARGGNIAKMGPYSNQLDAYKSLLTVKGHPIDGAFVWAEKVLEEAEEVK